jgi:hypothetical protein
MFRYTARHPVPTVERAEQIIVKRVEMELGNKCGTIVAWVRTYDKDVRVSAFDEVTLIFQDLTGQTYVRMARKSDAATIIAKMRKVGIMFCAAMIDRGGKRYNVTKQFNRKPRYYFPVTSNITEA